MEGRCNLPRRFSIAIIALTNVSLCARLSFFLIQQDTFEKQWRIKRLAFGNYNSTREKTSRTLVLVYTISFRKERKWIHDGEWCSMKHRRLKRCPMNEFEVTYDKQRFMDSDLVVFHARDIPRSDHLNTLLKSRPASQRWVFALWESPKKSPDTTPFNGLFNLTWTYRRDSDIWSPYGTTSNSVREIRQLKWD